MSDERILAELRALRADVSALANKTTPTVTVNELWPLFETANRERLKSWRDYAQRWRDHVGPAFGEHAAEALTAGDVDVFRRARREIGAAIATVNREIALLRRLLSFGVRRRLFARSQLHGPGMTSELIHPEDNVRTTIVEQDVAAAEITLVGLVAAAERRLGAMILLLHHGGLRRAEAAFLRWDRIDRRRGLAWLPGAETKGGRGGRHVPISSTALAAIDALPRRYVSPWVFQSHHHGVRGRAPVHPDWWTHRFGELVREIGLEGPDGPPWLHDLRRSFVTLSRRDGELESDIMEVTGHKTREVFDRYDAHDVRDVVRFRERREAARTLIGAQRRPPARSPVPVHEEKSQEVAAGNT